MQFSVALRGQSSSSTRGPEDVPHSSPSLMGVVVGVKDLHVAEARERMLRSENPDESKVVECISAI